MSKTGEQAKVPPPPLDEDGNLIVGEDGTNTDEDDNLIVGEDGTNTETSMAPALEELMRRLEELTVENKKHRAEAKTKRTK
jgi:hypothetical protein